jgi:hypothetical protein
MHRIDRDLLRWIGPVLMAVCCIGCGAHSHGGVPTAGQPVAAVDNRVAEPWISKPTSEWPQIVLTNHAEFHGHSSLQGASSFLIKTDDDRVLAATARHLIGAAGGVEPEIPVNQLTAKIQSWKMYPRTVPDDFAEITGLGTHGLDDENLDWLILSIENADPLPAYPLKLRKAPVRVGEPVYLIGCPYCEGDCKQNVYRGTVTERAFGDRFRYDLEPAVDVRGFSGAPIIDEKGYAVCVMTVWFEPKMSGEKSLEAGGEDVASIYEMMQRAN